MIGFLEPEALVEDRAHWPWRVASRLLTGLGIFSERYAYRPGPGETRLTRRNS